MPAEARTEDSNKTALTRQAADAREAALSEILKAIKWSTNDETPVFDAILRHARELCEASMAELVLGRPGDPSQKLAAHQGTSDDVVAMYETNRFTMDPNVSFAARAIIEEQIVHVEDMAVTEAYRIGDPTVRELVDSQGVRSGLFVPLISGEGGLGCIVLSRIERRPFTDHQIALAGTFAEQAVIGLENARRYRELQMRLEREAATREILRIISHSREDEKPVFDAILENAASLCKAPFSALSLVNEEGTHVIIPAHRGARPEFGVVLDQFREPITRTELVAVGPIVTGEIIRLDDIADTDAYRKRDPRRVQMVDVEGIRSLLVVPLLRNGVGIGAITLYRRKVAPFSDDDVALVQNFAAQGVIAIDNVRQFKSVQDMADEVRAQATELRTLNLQLESRVEAQVSELERLGRLRRFLPSQVADAVVSSGTEKLLSSHRALLGILFCDIRGFTAFCERAEPEETIEVLQTYHQEMGKLIAEHNAGVDHRMGDGIMVLFNDPLPCDDPAGDAVRLGLAMHARMQDLCKRWKRLGHRLGFGIGISLGYATVGMVGSEGRYDYTASGTAVNLAARLCDEAEDGEILLSPRAHIAVEDEFNTESRGSIKLKGIQDPVEIFRIAGL